MRTGGKSSNSVKVALTLISTLTLVCCSAVQHSYQLSNVVARSLSTATPEGEQRLALEAEYDGAVRDILTRKGTPEWLHIVSRDQLYLFFTSRDEVVVITRPMVPPGAVRIYERSPGFLLSLLPKHAIDELLAERNARAASSKPRTRRVARRRKGPAPPAAIASRQTDTSVSFQSFDSDRIVTRLRTPLSAADPGVTQWRTGRMRDGKPARVATSGTHRYVVRPEMISVSVPIAPRRRQAPINATLAIFRINQAVFGTRAAGIERRIEPLVSRVAADTSGRTRIRRRIAGRTIDVARDPGRGLLIYSILSN